MSIAASRAARILFIEFLGGIGDLVMALPAIEALARSHPSSEVDVLTFEPGAALLADHPAVARVRTPREILGRRDAPGAVEWVLGEVAYDVVVSDTRYEGIPELIEGSAPRSVTDLWRGPESDRRVGDRFLEILADEGLVDPAVIAPPRLVVDEQAIDPTILCVDRPLAFLLPEAGAPLKRWPLERFAEVGRGLWKRHHAQVLVASGGDPDTSRELAEAIGDGARPLPPTTLPGLAAWLRRGDLAISADTGPAHVAAAVGLPTITLFGPTWSGRYRPAEPNIALQGYPGCPERAPGNFTEQRCWQDGRCPFETWRSCTEDVTVDDVMEASAGLLSAKVRR